MVTGIEWFSSRREAEKGGGVEHVINLEKPFNVHHYVLHEFVDCCIRDAADLIKNYVQSKIETS